MTGIGSDIIALKSTDTTRTQNPRFYRQILTEAEQQLYRNSFSNLPFHYFVWLLWSIKESAYKCLKQQQYDLIFQPTKIIVTELHPPVINPNIDILFGKGIHNGEAFEGIIIYQSYTLYARSIIYGDELIHSIVLPHNSFENVQWGIERIANNNPEQQSIAVRALLLKYLQTEHPSSDIIIKKHEVGFPMLYIDDKRLDARLSFSHHGEWVGYALR